MVPTLLTFEFSKSCTMSNMKHTILFRCKNISKLYTVGVLKKGLHTGNVYLNGCGQGENAEVKEAEQSVQLTSGYFTITTKCKVE